ncbi:MAG: DNA polymerase III subunit beta [Bacteroidetes bacterium]|nr:DNA polymerase III subunit beta [Bacteroidota bacterium]
MELKVGSSVKLVKELQKIGGIIGDSHLPILDDFLFDIRKKEMTLFASDLETTMQVTVPVEADKAEQIAIPARLLVDFLKKLPDHPIRFVCDTKTFSVEIVSEYGNYNIAGHDPEEYPKIPTVEDGASLEIQSKILGEAFAKTIFATGTDDMRPVMGGVLFEITGNYITFVATDAQRLVRYRRNDVSGKSATSLILPKKPLHALISTLSNEDVPVKIQFNKSHSFFSFGNMNVICRLIDGKYPNYEAVIPVSNPNKMIIERKLFVQSLERVALFSNKTNYQVRFKISAAELNIVGEDIDFSNQAKEKIACNYTGEEMEIGFNAKFMAEMLNAIDTQNVALELSTPNRAGILLPEWGSEKQKEGDLLMLVMPIMLNT